MSEAVIRSAPLPDLRRRSSAFAKPGQERRRGWVSKLRLRAV